MKNLYILKKSIIFAPSFVNVHLFMADFYVNYGSLGAKLLAQYSCNKVNLKLHQVHNMYVISKNRKILKETLDPDKALSIFHNAIYLDQPGNDLFIY